MEYLLAADPVAPIGARPLLLFLLQCGLLLALAWVLGGLSRRCGLPTLVGELLAGVLLGPSVLGHALPDLQHWLFPADPDQFHMLDAAGQLGVLILVGITGVHIDGQLMRRHGLDAMRISVSSFVIPLALGIGAALLIPASQIPASADRATLALFLGVVMGVSAIPVIAKILLELRLIHHKIGQLTLCTVMGNDIAGWLLLSVVAAMATSGAHGRGIAISIAFLILTLAAAFALRPIVRIGFRAAAGGPEHYATIGLAVALILLSAAATQAMTLEAVFGAFVCGMVISSCGAFDPAHIAALRTTTMSVLAPLFFATAGLRVDLGVLAQPVVCVLGIALLVVAIVGKLLGGYLGARMSRFGHWEGVAIGAAVNARGVVEIVIAMVGLRLGVLSPELFTIVVMIAIVTSVMTAPLLRAAMARVEREEATRVAGQTAGKTV
ncbi:cation:proton antiporter [Nocardia sp. CDC159]|uniref:Cation:proton antiporter n=1 Tax=Nocardia pulmonis TaxID=2951408 RepID=A0A9X2E7D9_9NOCA|nr:MULTISPECIES: cation:proton antiporter [Nocardia]MCM6774558.1 cation:proton antiporter [Nocardia pulmonis]MCM6787377.1 cation:proton antiporter [Nocardia sp. CDC159]